MFPPSMDLTSVSRSVLYSDSRAYQVLQQNITVDAISSLIGTLEVIVVNTLLILPRTAYTHPISISHIVRTSTLHQENPPPGNYFKL
ncbi:hypothetical protein C8R48DRAFT_364635 [Suillus tomentosus]|nr:hypothetical protein C8R48DRAFT_364635 [Suillus tomentosus]